MRPFISLTYKLIPCYVVFLFVFLFFSFFVCVFILSVCHQLCTCLQYKVKIIIKTFLIIVLQQTFGVSRNLIFCLFPFQMPKLSSIHDSDRFLGMLNEYSFVSCECIVGILGVTLTPLSLVMEYLPLGALDKYLQVRKSIMKEVMSGAYFCFFSFLDGVVLVASQDVLKSHHSRVLTYL